MKIVRKYRNGKNGQFICDKTGVVLKYVHQLQNLYFAINNQELNVEL